MKNANISRLIAALALSSFALATPACGDDGGSMDSDSSAGTNDDSDTDPGDGSDTGAAGEDVLDVPVSIVMTYDFGGTSQNAVLCNDNAPGHTPFRIAEDVQCGLGTGYLFFRLAQGAYNISAGRVHDPAGSVEPVSIESTSVGMVTEQYNADWVADLPEGTDITISTQDLDPFTFRFDGDELTITAARG